MPVDDLQGNNLVTDSADSRCGPIGMRRYIAKKMLSSREHTMYQLNLAHGMSITRERKNFRKAHKKSVKKRMKQEYWKR